MGKRKRSIDDIDMLSGLADEILLRILSFLPTKLSVSTSVLAKRWRFLWARVPNLQFYGDDFRAGETKPLKIINRVLMLHDAKIIDTFSFWLSHVKGCTYQLETLIIYLIKRSVRNLCLDFGYEYGEYIACTLPRLLLTCKTLVHLKLDNCGEIPSSGELFLPSLKKLNLSYVNYEDDQSLPHLLSGCPVLEELIVIDCYKEGQTNSGCVIVSSPTIKTLNVDFTQGAEENPDEMLIIDVPAITYLKVIHCDLECVKSLRKTMTSLIETEITLNGHWHSSDIDCTEYGRSIEFLSCLNRVRYLKISSVSCDTLVGLVGTGSMPKFVNLTKLEIGLAVSINWHYFVKFLELADNLEVLIISLYKMPPYKKPKRVPPYKEPKRVTPCMLSRLRNVRMYYFFSCQETFDMVRYILRNAQVLERMEICPIYNLSDKLMLEALQTISLFERASKSCQVAFNKTL